MKAGKGEVRKSLPTTKVELDLEKDVAEQLIAMEGHTKMSRSELTNTALKRFISAHKDYFPDDYKHKPT